MSEEITDTKRAQIHKRADEIMACIPEEKRNALMRNILIGALYWAFREGHKAGEQAVDDYIAGCLV